MEQLLAHLKNLGFTEMESKIMVDLSRQGASSGYEVAKRLGASRSNIYAMLQRLNAEGYLHCSKGEPARYSMLTPEELTSKISDNVRQSLHFVERSMPRHHPGSPGFYNMEGDRQVLDTLLVRVAQAEKEIVIDMCPEEAALFHEELRAAEERGLGCSGLTMPIRGSSIPCSHGIPLSPRPSYADGSFLLSLTGNGACWDFEGKNALHRLSSRSIR